MMIFDLLEDSLHGEYFFIIEKSDIVHYKFNETTS